MINEYYSYDWVVRPSGSFNTLRTLRTEAKEFGYHVAIKNTQFWKRRPDGIHVIPFVFQIPSEDRWGEFSERIRSSVELTARQITTEEDFIEASLNLVPVGATTDFELQIEQLGQYNEAVLSGTPMWSTCLWIAQIRNSFDLVRTFKFLDEWEYSLFYRAPEPCYLTTRGHKLAFIFVVKVRPVLSLNSFKIQMRPYMFLESWNWLYKSSRDPSPVRTLETVAFAQMTPFSRDYATEFLRLAEIYGRFNQDLDLA